MATPRMITELQELELYTWRGRRIDPRAPRLTPEQRAVQAARLKGLCVDIAPTRDLTAELIEERRREAAQDGREP